MPAPAGTGLDRRTFLSRTLGAALTVYGAAALGPSHARRGRSRAPRRRRRRATACSSRSSPPAAGMRSRSSTRPATRATAGCARARAEARRRARVPLRLAPALAPVAQPLAKLHAHGQLTVFPAIGYSHPDQSHFTSRHFWEVGALDPQHEHRLARPPARRDRRPRRTRCRACRSTARCCRRSRPRSMPVATLASPTDYGFDSHNVWDVAGELLDRRVRVARRRLGQGPDPALAQASRTVDAVGRAAPPARTLRRKGRPGAHQPEGQVPGRRLRRAGSRASPRCSTPASRSAPPRCRRPGATTPTPTGGAARRMACKQTVGGPRSVPGRPRAARHRGPGADARLERVRPPRRSRTTRTAPTTAPPAPRS